MPRSACTVCGADAVAGDRLVDELLGQDGVLGRRRRSSPGLYREKMSISTYRWYQTPFAGPRSFVMSQDHTWDGAVGDAAPVSPAPDGWPAGAVPGSARRARAIRYMLDIEHR